jgi:hypothetical protein
MRWEQRREGLHRDYTERSSQPPSRFALRRGKPTPNLQPPTSNPWHRGCVIAASGGKVHARKTNDETSARGQACGEGCVDAGGRVRARRNPPRPRRQARRAIVEAGDRDRSLQGAAGRRRPAGSAGEHEAEREIGEPRRHAREAALRSTIVRRPPRTEAGGPKRRVSQGAFTPGAERRAASIARVAQRRCPKECEDQRRKRSTGGRPSSGAHAQAAADKAAERIGLEPPRR